MKRLKKSKSTRECVPQLNRDKFVSMFTKGCRVGNNFSIDARIVRCSINEKWQCNWLTNRFVLRQFPKKKISAKFEEKLNFFHNTERSNRKKIYHRIMIEGTFNTNTKKRERERVSSTREARLVFGVVCSRFVVSKPSNLNRGSQCQFFSNFHIIHFLFALIFCYFHRLIFLKLNMFVKIWWWALGFNFLSFSLTTSPWFSFKSLSIQKIDESFSRILLGLWYRLNQSQSHRWWFQCHQWLLSNWKSNSIEFGLIFNMGPHTVRLCLRMKEEIEKSIENHSLWRVCVCVCVNECARFISFFLSSLLSVLFDWIQNESIYLRFDCSPRKKTRTQIRKDMEENHFSLQLWFKLDDDDYHDEDLWRWL